MKILLSNKHTFCYHRSKMWYTWLLWQIESRNLLWLFFDVWTFTLYPFLFVVFLIASSASLYVGCQSQTHLLRHSLKDNGTFNSVDDISVVCGLIWTCYLEFDNEAIYYGWRSENGRCRWGILNSRWIQRVLNHL